MMEGKAKNNMPPFDLIYFELYGTHCFGGLTIRHHKTYTTWFMYFYFFLILRKPGIKIKFLSHSMFIKAIIARSGHCLLMIWDC